MAHIQQWGDMTIRKSNILVVDDNDEIRRLICEILEQSGYRVRRASDGIAALEQLEAEIPDVILSDLYMPRMSGFELLPVVRQNFPTTRVVAMSSSFFGTDVPPGVFADAFYEKASSVFNLLEVLERLTLNDQPPLYAPHAEAVLMN